MSHSDNSHQSILENRGAEARLDGEQMGQILPLLGATCFWQDGTFRGTRTWGVAPNFEIRPDDSFLERVHADDRDSFLKGVHESGNTGGAFRLDYRLLPGDGTVRYVADFRMGELSGEGEVVGYRGFWLDRTATVLSERRLEQGGWQESLFLAMRVLLHDFNNVITGMYALLDSMGAMVDSESEDHESVTLIRERTRQAQELVSRVGALNQKKMGMPTLCALEEFLREQEDLLRTLLPKEVDFQMEFEEGSFPVCVDVVSLQSILLVFAANARDAIGHQGEVRLSLRRTDGQEPPDEGAFFCATSGKGPAVELVFRDDGCGIPAGALGRIVDPYYSTHPRGHGAGAGLFNARRLAQNNGFGFRAVSREGVGTEMILTLPLLSDDDVDLAPEVETVSRRALVWGVGELDPEGLPALLQADDWEVRVCASREEAEAIVRESGKPFDLILLDAGANVEIPQALLEWLPGTAHGSLRVLRLTGWNPDLLEANVRDSFDLILDANRGVAEDLQYLYPKLQKAR